MLGFLVLAAGARGEEIAAGGRGDGGEPTPAADEEREVAEARMGSTPGLSRSRSTSGQFIVYSEDLKLRGSFSNFAEGVKRDYLGLLRVRDQWRHPIIIVVRPGAGGGGPDASAVRTRFDQVEGGGFRFLIEARLSRWFSLESMREELVRALMAENVLRRYGSAPATRDRLIPPWLFRGVCEAMEFRRGGRPDGLFSSILESGYLMEIGQVFEVDPDRLDSVSREVYRASCGALVLTLLDQPAGAKRFDLMLERMVEIRG